MNQHLDFEVRPTHPMQRFVTAGCVVAGLIAAAVAWPELGYAAALVGAGMGLAAVAYGFLGGVRVRASPGRFANQALPTDALVVLTGGAGRPVRLFVEGRRPTLATCPTGAELANLRQRAVELAAVLEREVFDAAATEEEQQRFDETGERGAAGWARWELRSHRTRVAANRREFPNLHAAPPVEPPVTRDLHSVCWTVGESTLKLDSETLRWRDKNLPLHRILAVDYFCVRADAMEKLGAIQQVRYCHRLRVCTAEGPQLLLDLEHPVAMNDAINEAPAAQVRFLADAIRAAVAVAAAPEPLSGSEAVPDALRQMMEARSADPVDARVDGTDGPRRLDPRSRVRGTE